ncbi:cell division protein SepF [Metaclostridioides mangenotii]|uniref:Cell division protein SepF n=1 Tax=Metaclostridioides mangenotii TaxID=1540 RepID=A0ABS4EA33_9FIRM|nr:cell division protein SepF [Clostridioides mangenotii]MBP1854768.1 cell division inhibitor SepF [Clostridioides mangenotii]
MGDGIISKFKNWIVEEDEEFVEEEYEESVESVLGEEDLNNAFNASKGSKIVNLHTANQMKVVIVEPKVYDDAATIADHLKQRRAVIVNLEGLASTEVRKSIFNFMNGAVYVLDGSIQKVSKSIFILAPNNVDIDANMKKELESKAFFPWQNK